MNNSTTQKHIYVLDRYTNKNIKILNVDEGSLSTLKAGDKVVYTMEDNYQKPSIGVYLGHDIDTDRLGKFTKILSGDEKIFFEEQHQFALKIFPLFKKRFKQEFSNSIPITARFHIYLDQLYFYFYSEERYVFTDFVKKLREKIGKNIFLFQVGARDMVKMDPRTDYLPCGADGIIPMHCKTTLPLPSIEMENLILQQLEGRDIERLKGRCGKLKCSLIYELEIYKQESKKYPPKGSEVKYLKSNVDGIVTSYNIMTGDVSIKTKDGEMFRVPTGELKLTKLPDPKTKTDEEKELEKIKNEIEG